MLDAARFTVPYAQHTHFVGRDEDLARLHAALSGGKTVGINAAALSNHIGVTGQGGIGKTQLAVDYAYRYQDHYPDGVYWLNATVDLRQEFSALADKLNLPLPSVSATTLSVPDRQRLVEELASGPWLLGDAMSRWALLNIVGLGHFATGLNLNGSSREVAASLVARLEPFGFMPDRPTHQALGSLLDYLVMLPDIPPDTAQWLSSIIQHYGLITIAAATQSQDERVQAAFAWLRAHPHSLLILDNVADPAVLGQSLTRDCVLGSLPCRLLFTTRQRTLGRFQLIELKTLGRSSALELLLRSRGGLKGLDENGSDYSLADSICAMLGDLPLALEIAAAQLQDLSDISLSEYRTELRMRGALDVLEDQRASVEIRHEVGFTAVLFSQWERLSPEAQMIMRVAGQLWEAVNVPEARLGLLAGIPDKGRSVFDPTYKRVIGKLVDLSLLERLEGNRVRLHPIVHAFARKQVPEEKKAEFREACIHRLLAAFGDIETLERQCDTRGIDELIRDLIATEALLDRVMILHNTRVELTDTLRTFLRVFQREAHNLRGWRQADAPGFLAQQLCLRLLNSDKPTLFGDLAARVRARGPAWVPRWSTRQVVSELERTLRGHKGKVWAVAVTLDGRKIVSGGSDHTLRVWDVETGLVKLILSSHQGQVNTIMVTPDGKRVVSGGDDGIVRVWNLETGDEEWTLNGHRGWVLAVAVTTDGREIISTGDDHTVRLWNLETGREQRIWYSHEERISAVTVRPDGRSVIFVGDKGTIHVWNLDQWHVERTLSGHRDRVNALAVTRDGQVAVYGNDDGIVRVRNLGTGVEEWTLSGHQGSVLAVAVLPDGRRIVSGGEDGCVRVWGLDTGREEWTLRSHSGKVLAVEGTPHGRIISSGDDGAVRVWNLDDWHGERTQSSHRKRVNALVMTPDRRKVVSGGEDGVVRVWNLNSGREVGVLSIHQRDVRTLAITPDGRRVISGGYDGVRVTNFNRRCEERTLSGMYGGALAVAVTSDGRRIVAGGQDSDVHVWNLNTGRKEWRLSGHQLGVLAVAVTPDGRIVSGGREGSLITWNQDMGGQQILWRNWGGILPLAVTPDGHQIVSSGGSDHTVRLWDLDTGREECALSGHYSRVLAVAVTQDGRRIISCGDDRTMRIWNLDTKHELARVVLGGSVTCVAVVPGSPLIVVAGDADGNLYCLDLVE